MHLVKPKGSRFYRGRYRLSNGPKWYDVALRVAQKDIAETKLRNLVRDAEAELAYFAAEAEKAKAAATPAAEKPAEPAAVEAADEDAPLPEIEYDDFAKIDLRLAKVVAAEEIKKSKKLLKLTVEVGEETRTVVSGIKQWYAPEDLVGKTVVLVANLKPVTLCGVESRGMILCASDEADVNLSALTTLAPMESGLKVR